MKFEIHFSLYPIKQIINNSILTVINLNLKYFAYKMNFRKKKKVKRIKNHDFFLFE